MVSFRGARRALIRPKKPVVAAAGGFSAAFVSANTQSGSGVSFTFTAQSIGAASSDRIVVVAVQAVANGTGLSFAMTIGGNTATSAVTEFSNGGNLAGIYYLAVPSGTTANIVLTVSGTTPNLQVVQIGVYSITGCTTLPSGGASVGTTAWGVIIGASMVVTATLPSGGAGIAAFGTDRPLAGTTWSVGTQDTRQNDAGTGDDLFAVSISGSGSKTLTSSSVTTNYNAAMATFGP